MAYQLMVQPLESKYRQYMKLRALSLILITGFFCTSANASTAAEASKGIQTAENLWYKTKLAGHEWNTIKPLVAQAKQSLNNKEYTAAIELSNKAAQQAKLALIQAEHEKTNWLHNLPK